METVGRLARRLGLSRSTLLYYDRLGLLQPSGRSAAGYRLYTAADAERLEKILLFRDVGIPLEAIGALLGAPGGSVAAALESRLAGIRHEIAELRRQQDVVVRLLAQGGAVRERRLDKAQWVALLRAAGLDDDAMALWHAEFERSAPEAHAELLASLGIGEAEAVAIRERARERSRAGAAGSPAAT
jgi:DNA-binding transcriptional MerR regulator